MRFNRAELRYDPEQITADFTLENLLDTEETNIEAVIDLAQASRLALAPSESASKTIAAIDSHSTADLTWQLIPQPSSTMLDVGAHGVEILLAATPANRHVAVTYVIRTSTGIGQPHAAPGALTLDAWPQPVPSGTRLHVRIDGQSGETVRLTLHDMLGRESISQNVESYQSIFQKMIINTCIE